MFQTHPLTFCAHYFIIKAPWDFIHMILFFGVEKDEMVYMYIVLLIIHCESLGHYEGVDIYPRLEKYRFECRNKGREWRDYDDGVEVTTLPYLCSK